MRKIVIAKSGFNALTETDPDNLRFSSDYNTLKYDISGSDSFTIEAGETTGEHTIVTHNLNYIPFFVVFSNDPPSFPTRYYALPFSFADAGVFDHRFVYSNKTALIFRFENSEFLIDINLTFHYKIYKNDLGLS